MGMCDESWKGEPRKATKSVGGIWATRIDGVSEFQMGAVLDMKFCFEDENEKMVLQF